jgi:hypothetical protein
VPGTWGRGHERGSSTSEHQRLICVREATSPAPTPTCDGAFRHSTHWYPVPPALTESTTSKHSLAAIPQHSLAALSALGVSWHLPSVQHCVCLQASPQTAWMCACRLHRQQHACVQDLSRTVWCRRRAAQRRACECARCL